MSVRKMDGTLESVKRAKRKYDNKHYDQLCLKFPKGIRNILDNLILENQGNFPADVPFDDAYYSKTSYIYNAIKSQYKQDTGKDLDVELHRKQK